MEKSELTSEISRVIIELEKGEQFLHQKDYSELSKVLTEAIVSLCGLNNTLKSTK